VEARPRVLIIDDSEVVRGLLARGLQRHGCEVVGEAAGPYAARDLVVTLAPDVLTLDIEMPRMNGLTFLERLMAFKPMPVVVLSSLTPVGSKMALRALELGALEVLAKPAHDLAVGGDHAMAAVAMAVRAAASVRVKARWTALLKHKLASRKAVGGPADRVLALAASTGGTQALPRVLAALPAAGAACVIVQHMPAAFTGGFAERLDELSPWKVREAVHGGLLLSGEALLAPGDQHLLLMGESKGWRVALRQSPPVNYVRPSADVLLLSVAQACGPRAAGAVLTGMGRDGAAGLLALRQAGGRTLAQDEASSVVYGMPKEAWDIGGAEQQLGLEDLGPGLRQCLENLG
jgi:two-component system chemotaxis response regulator CheB